jgi:hypothetical protein
MTFSSVSARVPGRTVLAIATLAAVLLGQPRVARAQVEIDNNFKYNSGQEIQPIFEGWSHTPDGGFLMHFGYLNRNWVQELAIAIGSQNNFEPGGSDRGQPTYFYTRTQRNMFTVAVPKDWGRKELVWTVTANGKTQKAIGWLQPEWEIDPAGGAATGGNTTNLATQNQPPTLSISPVPSATVGQKVTISAAVTDDGLPKPAAVRKAAVGQETPPLLQGGTNDVPVNVPQLAPPAAAGGAGAGRGNTGPTVSWIVWRGPAGVSFTPRTSSAKDGKTETVATFTKPGEYVLRGRASDRVLTTDRDVKVIVK